MAAIYACKDARCLAAAMNVLKMRRNELIFMRVQAFIALSRDELQPRLLASACMPLARLAIDCSRPPVAGSRCDEYSHTAGLSRAGMFCRARRRLLERQGLPIALFFGTMPHVAAYGILAVQALFFFLGGRSGSAAITVMR